MRVCVAPIKFRQMKIIERAPPQIQITNSCARETFIQTHVITEGHIFRWITESNNNLLYVKWLIMITIDKNIYKLQCY